MAGRKEKSPTSKLIKLPETRIKTIMRSSPEVENIGQEALFLVNKATEMFVQYLAKLAYESSKKKRELIYCDLAEIVQTDDTLSFLKEMVPRKITFRECKEIFAAKGLKIPYEDDSNSGEKDSEDGANKSDSTVVCIKEEILSDHEEEGCDEKDNDEGKQNTRQCQSDDSEKNTSEDSNEHKN